MLKRVLLFLILSLLSNNFLFAQKELSIGVQPIFNTYLNIHSASGEHIKGIEPLEFGWGGGLHLDYAINKHLSINPFLKYYTQKQRFYLDGISNVFTTRSNSFYHRTYTNLNLGLLFNYQINHYHQHLLNIVSGFSYSILNKFEEGFGTAGISSGSVTTILDAEVFSGNSNMFNISLGVNRDLNIKRVGHFKYGFLLSIPLHNMPELRINSLFLDKDNTKYNLTTRVVSKQYTLEFTLIYNFFNFHVNKRNNECNRI